MGPSGTTGDHDIFSASVTKKDWHSSSGKTENKYFCASVAN